MIKLDVKVSAGSLLSWDKKRLKKLMRQAGQEVAAVARALIRRSEGGGRTYLRDGRRYQASAPGQAPVRVSGALLRGIKVRPFKSGEGVAIRDSEFYARILEGGARGGGRVGGKGARNRRGKPQTSRVLLPRPFLSLALTMRQGSLGQRIRAAVMDDVAFKKMKA